MKASVNDRLDHCRAVADYMYTNCNTALADRDEMYILGLVHDIGYRIDNSNHNIAGGIELKTEGYKYWREVYYHGTPNCVYKSYELTLLNSADMQIDQHGRLVGYEQRLNDIGNRYGIESKQYINAVELIKELKTIE